MAAVGTGVIAGWGVSVTTTSAAVVGETMAGDGCTSGVTTGCVGAATVGPEGEGETAAVASDGEESSAPGETMAASTVVGGTGVRLGINRSSTVGGGRSTTSDAHGLWPKMAPKLAINNAAPARSSRAAKPNPTHSQPLS